MTLRLYLLKIFFRNLEKEALEKRCLHKSENIFYFLICDKFATISRTLPLMHKTKYPLFFFRKFGAQFATICATPPSLGHIPKATLIQKAPSPELWWTWATFAGTLVNVRELILNMTLWVRQSSPNFAMLHQSSHEGARMLLENPGICLIHERPLLEISENYGCDGCRKCFRG